MYICIIRVNVGQEMLRKFVFANDLIGIWNMYVRLIFLLKAEGIVNMCLMIVMTMNKIYEKIYTAICDE